MRAVNLIPVEQRSGTSVGVGRSQGGAYAVLVLVAGVAVLAVLYGLARNDVASKRAQAAAVTARAAQTSAEAERLAPYTSFVAQRQLRTQAVETLVDTRFDWAHALHEIGRVLPVQTSISSLSGTVGSTTGASAPAASSSSVASATPAGSVPTFTLAGCATSQPTVALMLERLRLIDGVSEVTLQSSTAGGGSSGGTSGGCAAHEPAFTVAITFDPLPSTSALTAASSSATKSVADAGASGAKPTEAGTPGSPR